MNRRRVLKLIANCAIGSILSSTRAFAETAAGPQMTALSAYMGAARSRALPADVAEQAKHHLLDTLASIISGSRLSPGVAAQR
jgi:2-methylcitrate dehydratase PrpD